MYWYYKLIPRMLISWHDTFRMFVFHRCKVIFGFLHRGSWIFSETDHFYIFVKRDWKNGTWIEISFICYIHCTKHSSLGILFYFPTVYILSHKRRNVGARNLFTNLFKNPDGRERNTNSRVAEATDEKLNATFLFIYIWGQLQDNESNNCNSPLQMIRNITGVTTETKRSPRNRAHFQAGGHANEQSFLVQYERPIRVSKEYRHCVTYN